MAKVLLILTLIVLLAILCFAYFNMRSAAGGVSREGLATCPGSPNCVSSQSEDAEHQIDPFVYPSELQDPIALLEQVALEFPRTKLVLRTDRYLHVTFTSKLFRFVDDVEFFLEGNGKIQVRSSSRVGYSDLGVNRRRVEEIRRIFSQRSNTE